MATWKLDAAHSEADFTVRHMMVTNVRGEFGKLEGTIEFDPENRETASVEATIYTDTINTRVADRDAHLRSADFFDVETYPHITFKSTSVTLINENEADVVGDLTIKDVTKQVTLRVKFTGEIENSPFGDHRVAFEADTAINREDFGLTWNQALEAGGWLVGHEVKIHLEAQAARVTEEVPA